MSNLDRLELEWLHSTISSSGNGLAKLYVVWESQSEPDRIEIGPLRWGHAAGGHVVENTYDVSPFPGAWTRVPESCIIRVTHVDIVRTAVRESW